MSFITQFVPLLYLIEILHQTTTGNLEFLDAYLLYLIEILHQTTTLNPSYAPSTGCILSKFYIKPQRGNEQDNHSQVVSYRNSTSNHNNCLYNEIRSALYLIEILHQTTTVILSPLLFRCCILSKFYIKPQLENDPGIFAMVVSYRNSTSNHNMKAVRISSDRVVSYRNSTSNHNYVS